MSFRRELKEQGKTLAPVFLAMLAIVGAGCGQLEELGAKRAEEDSALERLEAERTALEQEIGFANAQAEAAEEARAKAEAQAQAAREAALAAKEELAAVEESRAVERERLLRAQESLLAEQARQREEQARTASRLSKLESREQELFERERELEAREVNLAVAEDELRERETEAIQPTVRGEGPPAVDLGRRPEAPPQAMLQPGQVFEVEILETLSSRTHRLGDTFAAQTVRDLRAEDGTLIIPAGSEVIGEVTEVTPLTGAGGRASIGVEFTRMVVPSGDALEIRAGFYELGADQGKNRKKVIGAAVAGAILGRVLGGKGAENAVLGAVVGAAAGGAAVARARDRDAVIPAGEVVALQLEEVVTVELEMTGPVRDRR